MLPFGSAGPRSYLIAIGGELIPACTEFHAATLNTKPNPCDFYVSIPHLNINLQYSRPYNLKI